MIKKRYYNNDAFEQQRLLLQELSRPVIFDVGAYIGDISKKYLSLFPYAIIHAFEPYDESYKKIEQNLKNFNNIRTYNFAFSNKCGRSAFNINKFHPTNSLLKSSNQGEKFWGKDLLDTQNIISIETTTIDDFCSQQNISKIDILKLDTQGSEYMILEGARNMLDKKNISLIYMEIILVETYLGQRLFPEVTDLLALSGYRLFGIYNQRISKTNDLNQIDTIFIPSEAPVE